MSPSLWTCHHESFFSPTGCPHTNPGGRLEDSIFQRPSAGPEKGLGPQAARRCLLGRLTRMARLPQLAALTSDLMLLPREVGAADGGRHGAAEKPDAAHGGPYGLREPLSNWLLITSAVFALGAFRGKRSAELLSVKPTTCHPPPFFLLELPGNSFRPRLLSPQGQGGSGPRLEATASAARRSPAAPLCSTEDKSVCDAVRQTHRARPLSAWRAVIFLLGIDLKKDV